MVTCARCAQAHATNHSCAQATRVKQQRGCVARVMMSYVSNEQHLKLGPHQYELGLAEMATAGSVTISDLLVLEKLFLAENRIGID